MQCAAKKNIFLKLSKAYQCKSRKIVKVNLFFNKVNFLLFDPKWNIRPEAVCAALI